MTRTVARTGAAVALAALKALTALVAASACPAWAACELVLLDHRSGRELQRLPLHALAPQAVIAFEHSVLGTTVSDHYQFTPQARLVREDFDGAGYGLPFAAEQDETLTHEMGRSTLRLNRLVHPLVVRPLPDQGMRLLLNGQVWLLASFGTQAIELRAVGCAAQPTSSHANRPTDDIS